MCHAELAIQLRIALNDEAEFERLNDIFGSCTNVYGYYTETKIYETLLKLVLKGVNTRNITNITQLTGYAFAYCVY